MATSRWIAKNVGNARHEEAQMFEIPYGSIPQTSWLNSKNANTKTRNQYFNRLRKNKF